MYNTHTCAHTHSLSHTHLKGHWKDLFLVYTKVRVKMWCIIRLVHFSIVRFYAQLIPVAKWIRKITDTVGLFHSSGHLEKNKSSTFKIADWTAWTYLSSPSLVCRVGLPSTWPEILSNSCQEMGSNSSLAYCLCKHKAPWWLDADSQMKTRSIRRCACLEKGCLRERPCLVHLDVTMLLTCFFCMRY